MEEKPFSVRREDERHIHHLGVAKGLLHAGADRVGGILRFDHSQGDVGLPVEDVIGILPRPSAHQLAANDDAALGQVDFLPNLRLHIPPGLDDGRGDELGADVALGEVLLVHLAGSGA